MAMFGARKTGGSAVTRSRWAAIGAAVAVTLGAGGIGFVAAAPSQGGPVLVSITPCRLVDTRPDTAVGPRRAALGPGETYTFAATGSNGNCAGIPADAVALSMNVTGVAATDPTFLTVFPAGGARPDASSLNLAPGAAATPNAVVSGLGSGGQLSIFNLNGTAHVLVDVNGYYVDHNHDDRYVLRPTTEVQINPMEFTPIAGGAWTTALFFQRHPATAGAECVLAPVDLPAGVPLIGMSVLYTSTTPVTITVGVFVINREPGTVLQTPLSVTGPAPASPAAEAAEVTLAFTAPGTTSAAFNYVAAVCTRDALTLNGVAVRFV